MRTYFVLRSLCIDYDWFVLLSGREEEEEPPFCFGGTEEPRMFVREEVVMYV